MELTSNLTPWDGDPLPGGQRHAEVADALALSEFQESDARPHTAYVAKRNKLSNETWKLLATFLGEQKADGVAKDVAAGEMTLDEALAWGQQIESDVNRSQGRADIEPEQWRDAEDGWDWRPN